MWLADGGRRAGGPAGHRLRSRTRPTPTTCWRSDTTGGVFGVFPSRDGGATFDAPLYQAAAGDGIGGVEIARSRSARRLRGDDDAAARGPKLARSGDGGATWTVDGPRPDARRGDRADHRRRSRTDPNTVLLRVLGADGQAIALTRDGGATVTVTLSIAGTFTSYVAASERRPGWSARWSTPAPRPRCSDRTTAARRSRRCAGPPGSARCPSAAAWCTRRRTTSATATRWARRATRAPRGARAMAYDQVQAITRLPARRAAVPGELPGAGRAGRGVARHDLGRGRVQRQSAAGTADAVAEPPAMTGGGGCGCARRRPGPRRSSLVLFLGSSSSSRRRA